MKLARVSAYAALVVVTWVALAAWSVMSPVGASPDEDYHLAMIYCAAGDAECVAEGTREGPCYTMRLDLSASCSDWQVRTTPETDGIITSHYPPFYYRVMSVFVVDNLADTTLNVRLANSSIAVGMLALSLALTAKRLRPAALLSWPVAMVPLAVYFVTSVNPSSWVIIGFAAIWGPLVSFLSTDERSGPQWSLPTHSLRTVSQVGFVLLAAFIALAGRTEGALFLPLLVGAVALITAPWPLTRITRATWLRWLLPTALVGLSAVFLLLFARTKATRVGGITAVEPAEPNYAGWEVVQHTINSFIGALGVPGVPGAALGSYDVPVPAMAAVAATVAYGGATLVGLGVMFGRKALGLGFLVGSAVVITAVLWSRENWEYYQPRYFLPLTVLFLGLVLLPRAINRPDPKGKRPSLLAANSGQLLLILGAAAVANSVAMLSTIQRFLDGVTWQPSRDPVNQYSVAVDPSRLASTASPDWWWLTWPLDPWQTWVIGTAAFLATVTLVFVLLRSDASTQQIPPAPRSDISGDVTAKSRFDIGDSDLRPTQ